MKSPAPRARVAIFLVGCQISSLATQWIDFVDHRGETVVRSRRAQGVIGSLRNYRAEMKRRPRHRRQTITRIPRAAA